MFMGADWAGVDGQPGDLKLSTGLVKRATQLPNWDDYDIVVLQQPRGREWLAKIHELQSRGIKVIYEIDDYLHGIRKMKDHDFKDSFTKEALAEFELCMRVCDGLIASTDYIARRYRAFSKRTWACLNGIDTGRYNLTRPPRPTVNIGWAGGTGHRDAIAPWLGKVANLMNEHDEVCFVSIGQPFANVFEERWPGRALATPFTSIETYPAAMCMFDIALAPAGKGLFFRGKSDLRWLEASALGIPVIADPDVYPQIEDSVTGFYAASPQAAGDVMYELVTNESLRVRVGQQAREMVRETRDMRVMVRQWVKVFDEVLKD
jgi:glycosyltransferase involved in cell wall biosynthesis